MAPTVRACTYAAAACPTRNPRVLGVADLGGRRPGGAVPADHPGQHLDRRRRLDGVGCDHLVRVALAAEDHVGVGAVRRPRQRRVQVLAGHPVGDHGVRGALPGVRGADGHALHGGVGVGVPEPQEPGRDVPGGQHPGHPAGDLGGQQRPVRVDLVDGPAVVVPDEVGAAHRQRPLVPFRDHGVPGADPFPVRQHQLRPGHPTARR